MSHLRKVAESIFTFITNNIDAIEKDPESTISHIEHIIEANLVSKIKNELYVAYFDGSATPNPGAMRVGGYVRKGKQIIYQLSESIGDGTNNQAEYTALIKILEKLKEIGANKVQLFGDSELVVKQIEGEYRVNRKKFPHIAELYDKAKELMTNFEEIEIGHVPREHNKLADRLSKT